MRLYAITDRTLFSSVEALIEQAALWAAGGVGFIQIREKDLGPDDLAKLAADIVHAVRAAGGGTRVLLNGDPRSAASAGCDGVHLPSHLPGAAVAAAKGISGGGVVSVSCHTLPEVECARDHGADLILFAPVFEKRLDGGVMPGQGLTLLADASHAAAPLPVFALGGVTAANARDCMRAGAAGIAAIRLFVSAEWCSLR
jgi:thiamine-phosphate pyrophosphorylase